MKPELTHSPIARWTKMLAIIKKQDPEDYQTIVNRPDLDLGNLLKREIAFRDTNARNCVFQIKGPTGSGKSIGAGLPIARLLKPDWLPKGNVVYTDDAMMQRALKAEEGSVIMKDEDPREHGQGSGNVTDAIANLESAVVRFAKLHFIFVNPYETGHLVNFVVDTSREESRRRDGKLLAVIADVAAKTRDEDTLEERWLNIGKIELEVPPQEIVKEYTVEMVKFKNELRDTGGIGVRKDVYKRYEYLIPKLKADPDFMDIPEGRGGYFTERHYKYISSYHGLNVDDAEIFLLKAWKHLKVKIAAPPTVS